MPELRPADEQRERADQAQTRDAGEVLLAVHPAVAVEVDVGSPGAPAAGGDVRDVRATLVGQGELQGHRTAVDVLTGEETHRGGQLVAQRTDRLVAQLRGR